MYISPYYQRSVSPQLTDLGSPPHAHNTAHGCRPQQQACVGGCGLQGHCVGGLHRPQCQCPPGWAGKHCTTPTTPVTLRQASYMKVALSYTPMARTVTAQVRVRMTTARHGLLLRLAQEQHSAALSIHVREGVACVSVSGVGWETREACVEGHPLHDGVWHLVRGGRHGHNLVISVDDGDLWSRNESLVTFDLVRDARERPGQGPGVRSPPPGNPPRPLIVDRNDGVNVGGVPEFVGTTLVAVHDDLHDVCLDDLRISGRPMPLPPASNGTPWGQVTTLEGLEPGCLASDPCHTATCFPPFTCSVSWGQAICRCSPGSELVGRTCTDLDECTYQPCLNGGTCVNVHGGYHCVCGPGYAGASCEWPSLATPAHLLATPLLVAGLTLSVLLVVLLGVLLSLRLQRKASNGGTSSQRHREPGTLMEMEGKMEKRGGGGRNRRGREAGQGDEEHRTFLELMSLPYPRRTQQKMGQSDHPPPVCGPHLPEGLKVTLPSGHTDSPSSTSVTSGDGRQLDGVQKSSISGVIDLLKHLPGISTTSHVPAQELENHSMEQGTGRTESGRAKTGRGTIKTETGTVEMKVKRVKMESETGRTEAGVARAEAGVARAEAGVARAEAGVARAEAGVARAEAGVERAEAGVARAETGVAMIDADITKTEAYVERTEDVTTRTEDVTTRTEDVTTRTEDVTRGTETAVREREHTQ
ncbi:putative neural-cadherin 2 [Cherax quadricarinatus]|uniref:putative neural-cadherin 2 n=1 Tax=Cherax quadricarinatus TaxID=27406 RepID=UPI00387E25F9